MFQRANILSFALGAASTLLLSSIMLQFAPDLDLHHSLSFSTSLVSSRDAVLAQPLSSFREAWSLLPSPQPSARRFASSPEKICVMAADTRPLSSVTTETDPSNLDFRTFAVYHNLWWSLRHGYTYRMVHTERKPGYDPIWSKTQAIRDLVASPECELVVFFDSDAYVTQPSYSLDDLLDRWGFNEPAAMLMAMDQPHHAQLENRNATNTGFMVFRSGPKALQILDDIIACPETIEGCAHWKIYEKYEQTAFNLYIRPKLVEGEDLVLIPCDEGNGNLRSHWCHGKFVTHAWHALDTVNEKASAIIVKETFSWLSQVFDGERLIPVSAALAAKTRRGAKSLQFHQDR